MGGRSKNAKAGQGRKKEKGKIAFKKVSFKIQSPDRDEEVQKLINEKPNLQKNLNNKYKSTVQSQSSLFKM